MTPYAANMVNALALIVMGGWAYLGTENPSFTALIPVFFGLIFLISGNSLKKGNKVIAHIVVVLTLLVLISLFKPLTGVVNRNDTLGIFRVSVMMCTGFIAMIAFIRSFRQARRV